MLVEIKMVLLVATVLLGITGLILSIKACYSFNKTEADVLRAKAFLNKKFLHNNFVLVFNMGILAALHMIIEFTEVLGYPSFLKPFESITDVFYIVTMTVSMLFLALLAYSWVKLSPKT